MGNKILYTKIMKIKSGILYFDGSKKLAYDMFYNVISVDK